MPLELLFAPIVLFIMAQLATGHPTEFILILMASYCGFFGIVNPVYLGLFTPENMVVLMSMATVPALYHAYRRELPEFAEGEYFPLLMLALFAWGTILPILRGHSSLIPAIIEGKYLTLYLFVLYCIRFRTFMRMPVIKQALLISAAILALEVIVFQLSGVCPPGFAPVNPEDPAMTAESIHIMYPHVISLGIFILMSEATMWNSRTIKLLFLTLFFSGILLQGHFSILFITLVTVCFIIFKFDLDTTLRQISFVVISFLVAFSFISIVFVWPDFFGQYETNLSGAIISRTAINSQRITYFLDNILFGYGFIHESSSLGTEFGLRSLGLHDLRLATVDSGYLDLLVKFGVIGCTAALWGFGYFCKCLAMNASRKMQPVVIFVTLFFLVMLTWSLLTYVHGIIFLGLAIVFTGNKASSSDIHCRSADSCIK